MIIMAAIVAAVSCGGEGASQAECDKASAMIDKAYRAKDYPALLVLADSLGNRGVLSEGEAYYWQGYASDRMNRKRTAEFYWKTGMAVTADSESPEDLGTYARTVCRLVNLLTVRGEFESAMKTAVPATERLERLACDTTSDYTNLLIYIGCCQSRLTTDSKQAELNFERAYDMHLNNIESKNTDEAFKNAIAGVINIAYNQNETGHYDDALKWADRFGKLVSRYEETGAADRDYVDKQWGRYSIYRAMALEGLGRRQEAAAVYDEYMRTAFSRTAEGRLLVNDYLEAAGRWAEAADNYAAADSLPREYGTEMTLERIQNEMLKKYHANVKAGRYETATAVSRKISDNLDQAITADRSTEAKELETIRLQSEQIDKERDHAITERTWYFIGLLLLFAALFAAYTVYRRRTKKRLEASLAELKSAYSQVEQDTEVKERTSSEQRISCEIQMRMIPTHFPNHKDVEIYASLAPAKYAGGDIYDFFIRDEKLFFCIGDVKGSGVEAALTMAMTKAQFRTVSSHENKPHHIMSLINRAMIESNDEPISVSLLVGVLELKNAMLYYCNAGHKAPVLIGGSIGLLPVDMNLPVGQQFDWKYTVQETRIDTNTLIFLYTNGLVKAEDVSGNQFSEQRMMGESLQAMHGLERSPQRFIEHMTSAVRRFMGRAEQVDDLTMMCIRYKRQQDDADFQRNITLTNELESLAVLSQFIEEVCEANDFGSETAFDMNLALEEAVANVIKHAYPKGTKGDIHVQALADKRTLCLIVRDSGEPFDPTQVAEFNTDTLMDEQGMGGVGIHLMRNYMDYLNYERSNGQNVLTLVKIIKK